MAPRVFRCDCGHKLKFGAEKCGKCYEPTPIYNRTAFWWMITIVPLVMAYLILR